MTLFFALLISLAIAVLIYAIGRQDGMLALAAIVGWGTYLFIVGQAHTEKEKGR